MLTYYGMNCVKGPDAKQGFSKVGADVILNESIVTLSLELRRKTHATQSKKDPS